MVRLEYWLDEKWCFGKRSKSVWTLGSSTETLPSCLHVLHLLCMRGTARGIVIPCVVEGTTDMTSCFAEIG